MASSSSSSSSPKPSEHKPGEGKDELKEEKKENREELIQAIADLLKVEGPKFPSKRQQTLLNEINNLLIACRTGVDIRALDETKTHENAPIFEAADFLFQLKKMKSKIDIPSKTPEEAAILPLLNTIISFAEKIDRLEKIKIQTEAIQNLSLQIASLDTLPRTSTTEINEYNDFVNIVKENYLNYVRRIGDLDFINTHEFERIGTRFSKGPTVTIEVHPEKKSDLKIFNVIQNLEKDYIQTNFSGRLFGSTRAEVRKLQNDLTKTFLQKGLLGVKNLLEEKLSAYAKLNKLYPHDVNGVIPHLRAASSDHHFARQQALLLSYVYDALGETDPIFKSVKPPILHEIVLQVRQASKHASYRHMREAFEGPETKPSLKGKPK